jgi:predicted Fe-Mo cluster-binding NifX family protein
MKIAITAMTPDLEGTVDPRFGRCPYLLFVDTDTMEFEAVENPFVEASGGAGIQAGQLVASKGAKAVLTGSCGPNAYQTLSAAGIEVVAGVSGPLRAAVKGYRAGSGPRAAQGPDVPPHYGMGGGFGQGQGPEGGMGMGRGTGQGMGRGGGRGMGRGQGQGLGRGGGRGMGRGQGLGAGRMPGATGAPVAPGSAPPAKATGLDQLKRDAQALQDQLEQIDAKIAELEKQEHKEQK